MANFNTSPYFDDFDPAKHFYRVLFKPGFAVQARELNQLQSILQNQITSVGNHLFKKNSVVIPGGVSFKTSVDIVYVDLADPSTIIGKTITNAVSFDYTDDSTLDGSITAVVLAAISKTDSKPAALYVKYYKTASDGRGRFDATDTLTTVDSTPITFAVDPTYGASIGKAATISRGVFFTKETFVECDQQSVIIETDNTITNCIVGLNITTSIVTSDEDPSLLDNALGSPNQYAPGADRYKIDLTLVRVDSTTTINDDNFILMMKIENNVVTYLNNNTQYAEIMKMIARRTYDANGNFIVEGLDTAITKASDDEYIWTHVSPGRCYLGGYEYNQLSNIPVAIEKPRTAAFQQPVGPVVTYASEMAYFLTAGGSYLKEIPAENSLVRFLNAAPAFTKTATGTSGQNAIVVSPNNSNILVGQVVTGTGIGSNATVTNISGTTITLSVNNSGAVSGTVTFSTASVATIGYGIFKGIQYLAGDIADGEDIYKMFFEYISLEKGYSVENIGGILATAGGEGTAVLHRITLSNISGNFAIGDTIESSYGTAQSGRLYNIINQNAFLIKNTLADVPSADLVKNASGVTATVVSRFTTNYTTNFVPMIEVSPDPYKTLYVNNTNSTSYSVVRKQTITIPAGTGSYSYTSSPALGADETYDSFSSTNYFGFVTTSGSEQVIDLTGLSLIAAGKQWTFDFPVGFRGNTVDIYTTVIKTNVTQSNKSSSVETLTIVEPSKSWTALGHQDVYEIVKVVDGGTISTNSVTWASNLLTITTAEPHGLSATNTVVLKNLVSSVDCNGVYVVQGVISSTEFTVAKTGDPGTITATDGIVAVPPNINTSTPVTNRYYLDTGNTPHLRGTSLIKLKRGSVEPEGQIAVQYRRYVIQNGGNYISVDSYGNYGGDLSYIGEIQDIGELKTRQYIDFRITPSSYFFKNLGSTTVSQNKLTLKDLNLSAFKTTLIGKYVVGPAFLSGVAITAVTITSSGDTELTLASNASATTSASYFVGLNTTSLSLTDTSAGAVSYSYPKDGSRFSYSYTKFLPRQVLVYLNREGDNLSLAYQDVANFAETGQYRRSEFKLPLAYLYMKPYTVTVKDVQITKFENPVYKMLDIHDLKVRIDRTEYYTSLSLDDRIREVIQDDAVEGQTVSSRGLWNENFQAPLSQDVTSPDFAATIYDKAYVAPGTLTRTIPLAVDTTLNPSTWTRTGTAFTLPYTETRAFGNDKASVSNNLNPFDAINWIGKLTLNPSVDNWVDTSFDLNLLNNNTVRPQTTGSTTTNINTVVIENPTVQGGTKPPDRPPAILPPPPDEEIVTTVNVIRAAWGPDTAGGDHAITVEWATNRGRTGRINTDAHVSAVIRSAGRAGYDGTLARQLINKKYTDRGVSEYLNAGRHFDQKPPRQW